MATTRLSRTPASAGNRKIWTWSGWIKRSNVSSYATIFDANSTSTGLNGFNFRFEANAELFVSIDDGSLAYNLITAPRYRDTNGWYHLVLALDTTQATQSDRVKLWVNGTSTTLNVDSGSLAQNAEPIINSTIQHNIGVRQRASSTFDLYHDGQMAHVHFTDGTAYDADTFGETDATTGIWKPKTAPSVTYGTNGFFLKFENSGAMGTDSSGNGNNFSVSGNLTQTIDTPSNVFATMNPLDNYYNSSTFTNGNNTVQTATSTYTYNTSTLGVSKGKWYCEIEYDAETASFDNTLIGVASQFSTSNTQALGNNSNDWGYYARDGKIRNSNSSSAYGDTYTTGDVIGIALDLDNNKLYFAKNGTWQNSGDPTSGATGTGAISITDPASTIIGNYFIAISHYDSGSNATFKANFGNGYFGTTPVSSAQNPDDGIGIFEYDVPAGYRALCTKSINAEEYS